ESVLGAGGEEPIALRVQVEPDDLGEAGTFEQSFPRRERSQIENLLVIEMEQGLVAFAVEGRIRQKQEGGAGVDDQVGIVAQVVGRLGEQGGAGQVLAAGLERRKDHLEKLAGAQVFPEFIEKQMFGHTQMGAVINYAI